MLGPVKIERVEVFSLSASLPEPIGWSRRWIDRRDCILVRVRDSDGAVGWGEAYGTAADAPAVAELAALALGHDAECIEGVTRRLAHAAPRVRAVGRQAVGAVEMALRDLWGRRRGRPLGETFGARVRERVPVYASGLYYTPGDDEERLRCEARSYVAAGFAGVKMKIGRLSPAEDVARVRIVREAVGPDVALMADANGTYTADRALALARELESAELAWLEEPCPRDDDAGTARVRREASCSVAGGEHLFGRGAFVARLALGVFDVAQPDVSTVGGAGELAAVVAHASEQGFAVAPHFWGTGIALAAALQVLAVLPARPAGEPLLELDRTPNPLREYLTTPALEPVSGSLGVPEGPGLGVEVCEAALTRFLVNGPMGGRFPRASAPGTRGGAG